MDDGTHDEAFPVRVDVLRETGFERIVANDQTRGLNESGVLTFNLAFPPPPGVNLFGHERRWLRVRPREGFTDEWRPQIRAAYLNGTFARAAETQRLERLGSSDGSPRQRVFLARPPIIMESLELRVREPLGDEEMDRLRDLDPKSVRDDLAYPGRWVLWEQVADPDDAGKDKRAYSLDHESGEIKFGDGAHGMIPPIGVDSILAVHYKKGGGLAANRVNAWSQVNLITSLSGVQTVAAPNGAAGGSDPQDAETVVRFAPANQLMRNRAITLRDFEMQALQFSPDIAQAHAFQTDTGIRLIVVMAGRDPVPPQRVRRELAEFLGERTVPMFAAHGAIVIDPPEPVYVRVDVTLAIERIEHSAGVAPEVTRRIAALLDAKSGGLDRTGWPLGETPTDTDVAAVLDDLTDLEEIRLVRILDAETDAPVAGLTRHQLATLAAEGVTFRFQLVDNEEVLA
jgi:predicted phage baseplate assembly protein